MEAAAHTRLTITEEPNSDPFFHQRMSEVDSVGPFWVRQEWPGRHLNIAVKIAVLKSIHKG